MGIVGMLVFIPAVSVFYALFSEHVRHEIQKKNISIPEEKEEEENQSRMWRLKRRMEKKKEEAAKKLKENEEKSDEDK